MMAASLVSCAAAGVGGTSPGQHRALEETEDTPSTMPSFNATEPPSFTSSSYGSHDRMISFNSTSSSSSFHRGDEDDSDSYSFSYSFDGGGGGGGGGGSGGGGDDNGGGGGDNGGGGGDGGGGKGGGGTGDTAALSNTESSLVVDDGESVSTVLLVVLALFAAGAAWMLYRSWAKRRMAWRRLGDESLLP
ncbi:unnamed protein product [Ectocarpus sp. 8 AP-2014]